MRDILNIITFLKVNLETAFSGDVGEAFRHAVELVIIDGVCLGSDQSASQAKAITEEMHRFSTHVISHVLKAEV